MTLRLDCDLRTEPKAQGPLWATKYVLLLISCALQITFDPYNTANHQPTNPEYSPPPNTFHLRCLLWGTPRRNGSTKNLGPTIGDPYRVIGHVMWSKKLLGTTLRGRARATQIAISRFFASPVHSTWGAGAPNNFLLGRSYPKGPLYISTRHPPH